MKAATALAAGAALLEAVDTLLVKPLSHELHTFEILFFRNVFGFLLVLPWLLLARSERHGRGSRQEASSNGPEAKRDAAPWVSSGGKLHLIYRGEP